MSTYKPFPAKIKNLLKKEATEPVRNFGEGRRQFPFYTLYVHINGKWYYGTSTSKTEHPDLFRSPKRKPRPQDKPYLNWHVILERYMDGESAKSLGAEYEFNPALIYYYKKKMINNSRTTDAELVP